MPAFGADTNVNKVLTAPVTAIIGYDLRFYEQLPKLMPHNPGYKAMLRNPGIAKVFLGAGRFCRAPT